MTVRANNALTATCSFLEDWGLSESDLDTVCDNLREELRARKVSVLRTMERTSELPLEEQEMLRIKGMI